MLSCKYFIRGYDYIFSEAISWFEAQLPISIRILENEIATAARDKVVNHFQKLIALLRKGVVF
jgi:hypothetical protein